MGRNFSVDAVHKNMYPATYNFRDEADGAEPSGWTISNDLDCTSTIIASLDGHRKVLQLYDNNGGGRYMMYIDFDIQLASTIELWFRTTDKTQLSGFRLYDATPTMAISINLNALAGVVNDTWHHYRIQWDTTTDKYSHWLDGGLIASGIAFNNVANGITRLYIIGDNADTGYYNYIDAIGYSWDAEYAIGDNVHWRHYFDQDGIEDADVGDTTLTNYTPTVGGTTSFTIIQEFNEHKKLMELYDNDGADRVLLRRNATQNEESGWLECWIKTSDATKFSQIIGYNSDWTTVWTFCIDADKFQYYTAAAWADVPNVAVPSDDTWYHFKLIWNASGSTYLGVADNKMRIYINDISSGDIGLATDDKGARYFYFNTEVADSGYYFYIDAVSWSWVSGNEVGDNRTFDYNDTYTKEDITDDVMNITQNNSLHGVRKASLFALSQYTKATVFFQVFDITGKLGGEYEIKNDYYNGATYTHLLRDMNANALGNSSSNTFTTAKIHDPTDSGCMLKTVLPNVGHEDGRLLLVNADTEAATYSPVTKNYPDILFLRDLSNLANSVTIIEPSGKIDLDDDKESGDALDVDSDNIYFLTEPKITNIQEDINYFDIYGAIDPETGERFYKNIDNSGNDEKRSWSITNNNLRNQTDVDNFATAVSTRVVDIKQIRLELQGLQTHSMGETFNLTYSDDKYSIAATDFYIISEEYNYDQAKAVIVLSEGLIEKSDYAQAYERSFEETNVVMSQIYETDIITFSIVPFGTGGALRTANDVTIELVEKTDGATCVFQLSAKMDADRPITIQVPYYVGVADPNNFAYAFVKRRFRPDCSTALFDMGTDSGNLSCNTVGKYAYETFTISSDVQAGDILQLIFQHDDADDADLLIYPWTILYYLKRG